MMDILRHGRDVEVLKPVELKEMIRAELDEARSNYG